MTRGKGLTIQTKSDPYWVLNKPKRGSQISFITGNKRSTLKYGGNQYSGSGNIWYPTDDTRRQLYKNIYKGGKFKGRLRSINDQWQKSQGKPKNTRPAWKRNKNLLKAVTSGQDYGSWHISYTRKEPKKAHLSVEPAWGEGHSNYHIHLYSNGGFGREITNLIKEFEKQRKVLNPPKSPPRPPRRSTRVSAVPMENLKAKEAHYNRVAFENAVSQLENNEEKKKKQNNQAESSFLSWLKTVKPKSRSPPKTRSNRRKARKSQSTMKERVSAMVAVSESRKNNRNRNRSSKV